MKWDRLLPDMSCFEGEGEWNQQKPTKNTQQNPIQ